MKKIKPNVFEIYVNGELKRTMLPSQVFLSERHITLSCEFDNMMEELVCNDKNVSIIIVREYLPCVENLSLE